MCDCIKRMNGMLKEHNAAIVTNLFGHPMACVEMCKIETKKRGKLPVLQASNCPFCGEKYPEPKMRAAALIEQS